MPGSSISLKPPSNLALLFNEFNDLSIESNQTDLDNLISSKYDDTWSLFHINTCSLNKNFDGLEYLLKTTNQDFNIIAISESKFKKYFKLLQATLISKLCNRIYTYRS